jgi:hypothetical protein
VATLGITLASLAACGDSGNSSTQAFGARVAPGISLSVQLAMAGTYTINASWTDDISAAASAASCADAAKGFYQDGLRYILPRSPLSVPFDGHAVGVVAVIYGYGGPAGYDAPHVAAEDQAATLLTVDGAGWAAAGGGNAHVDVRPDDSGTLVFTKLTPTPPTPAPTVSGQPAATAAAPRTGTISGTMSWTCTNVRPAAPTAGSSSSSGTAAPAAPSGTPANPGPTPTPPH